MIPLASILHIIELSMEIALQALKDMTPEQRMNFWARHDERMEFWHKLLVKTQE